MLCSNRTSRTVPEVGPESQTVFCRFTCTLYLYNECGELVLQKRRDEERLNIIPGTVYRCKSAVRTSREFCTCKGFQGTMKYVESLQLASLCAVF